ncbi:hypothetical protein QSI_3677 [Clostridioides difficile P28]|nr:hypothetical protein QSI_3677 [Clostridioides difficile P28]
MQHSHSSINALDGIKKGYLKYRRNKKAGSSYSDVRLCEYSRIILCCM